MTSRSASWQRLRYWEREYDRAVMGYAREGGAFWRLRVAECGRRVGDERRIYDHYAGPGGWRLHATARNELSLHLERTRQRRDE